MPGKNGQCTFTVWAPECSSVQVVLDASPELPWQMEKGEFGYWTITIDQVTPGMRYWYKLDNELQRPDPVSRWQPQGVHGPSAITDISFNWTDTEWQGMELAELIIYELHTGTFTAAGNFQGIISKLDHLQTLGITRLPFSHRQY
jgi:maltooligosyltrehalose trehalohydrolase